MRTPASSSSSRPPGPAPETPALAPRSEEHLMLAVRTTPTRERWSLDGLWRFCLDPDGEGRRDNWQDGLPARAREMPVPASYNDVVPDPVYRDHIGDAW